MYLYKAQPTHTNASLHTIYKIGAIVLVVLKNTMNINLFLVKRIRARSDRNDAGLFLY